MSISLTEHVQAQPVALVSEKEYEYGADAFEAYMEKQGESGVNVVQEKHKKLEGQKR